MGRNWLSRNLEIQKSQRSSHHGSFQINVGYQHLKDNWPPKPSINTGSIIHNWQNTCQAYSQINRTKMHLRKDISWHNYRIKHKYLLKRYHWTRNPTPVFFGIRDTNQWPKYIKVQLRETGIKVKTWMRRRQIHLRSSDLISNIS